MLKIEDLHIGDKVRTNISDKDALIVKLESNAYINYQKNVNKEENKYRINQFWDITKDRGEFSGNTTQMYITEEKGYRKAINPAYINNMKLHRKKFRQYGNVITLKKITMKEVLKKYDLKMVLKLFNTKLLNSPR